MLSITALGFDEWGEEQTVVYFTEIANILDSLAIFPRMGRRTDHVPLGVFSIPAGHHSILYRINDDHGIVHILRIVHERMDIPTHLGK